MKFVIFIDIKMQAAKTMSIVLVINFKMSTVVGILKFMARTNFMLNSVEHEICYLHCYQNASSYGNVNICFGHKF